VAESARAAADSGAAHTGGGQAFLADPWPASLLSGRSSLTATPRNQVPHGALCCRGGRGAWDIRFAACHALARQLQALPCAADHSRSRLITRNLQPRARCALFFPAGEHRPSRPCLVALVAACCPAAAVAGRTRSFATRCQPAGQACAAPGSRRTGNSLPEGASRGCRRWPVGKRASAR